jgi:CDP-paratose 2-epimerase
VAHFVRRALAGQPITIYGDGLQVRDLLYIDDLVSAMMLARDGLADRSGVFAGRAFNIGGGPQNAVSLVEVVARIAAIIGGAAGARPDLRFGPWRPGDQRYYVSDTSAFRHVTGWAPRVSAMEGLVLLAKALAESEASGAVGVAPFAEAGEARAASGSGTP